MLAGADKVIPTALGQKLYDSYSGPKRLQVVPAAGHEDVVAQPLDWWKDVFLFWRQYEPTNRAVINGR
jgi:hypothetical protein